MLRENTNRYNMTERIKCGHAKHKDRQQKKLGLIFPTNIDEIFPPKTFILTSTLDEPKAYKKEY